MADPTIALAPCGGIALHMPNGHTLTIRVGPTQADYALAMAALMRLLRDRAEQAQPATIATPAALTQYQLDEVMRALKSTAIAKPPTKIPPKLKRQAPEELSLEDLDF